jgi:hypothetical protein
MEFHKLQQLCSPFHKVPLFPKLVVNYFAKYHNLPNFYSVIVWQIQSIVRQIVYNLINNNTPVMNWKCQLYPLPYRGVYLLDALIPLQGLQEMRYFGQFYWYYTSITAIDDWGKVSPCSLFCTGLAFFWNLTGIFNSFQRNHAHTYLFHLAVLHK